MEARQYKEFLLIQKVATTNNDFFNYMHERYLGFIYKEAKELPPKPPEPNNNTGMDPGSDAVKNMLTSFSQKLRRTRGYG